ncbi:MAG TPA: hypothetical protein VHU40_13030 [Polyangia bacterium]|jgi:hypothetical protein|nr:hypothetical protein [Polyangia bacterium]
MSDKQRNGTRQRPTTIARVQAKRRYSIGELVTAAYRNAAFLTDDEEAAAIIASQTLATWLARSDHPELIDRLRSFPA